LRVEFLIAFSKQLNAIRGVIKLINPNYNNIGISVYELILYLSYPNVKLDYRKLKLTA